MRAIQSIRAHVETADPIHVILDNLNHHKNRTVRTGATDNNVELVFTPTYASWANPIEAHFGPLRQFVIANSDHPDHRALSAHAGPSPVAEANTHAPELLALERKHRAQLAR